MNLDHRSRLLTRIAALLLLSLFAALMPLAVRAATIPVDTIDYGIVVDGDCSLVEAIIAANTNTSNDCPAGDDTPVDTIVLGSNITYTLPMSYATYLGPTGLPSITSTIVISGNNSTITRDSAEQFGLMHVSAMTGTLTLHDLTLRNGETITNGGAIANEGTLTVINSTIISNSAASGVGGIFSENATATFIDSLLFSNAGPAIGNFNSTVNIVGSQIISNGKGIRNVGSDVTLISTEVISNGSGGIWSQVSTLMLTNTHVLSNSAWTSGAGLYNDNSVVQIADSYIAYNKTFRTPPFDPANFGGGIFNTNNSTVTVANTRIISNVADLGGGIASITSTLTVETSEVALNSAYGSVVFDMESGAGGGIYGEASHVTVANSRLVANIAQDRGGGVHNQQGMMTITNTQILTNTGLGYSSIGHGAGGGIFNSLNGFLEVANTNIISNTGGYGSGGIDNQGTMTVTQSYIISNTANLGAGVGNTSQAAMLTIKDSFILSNTTVGEESAIAYGGAIFNGGTAFITNTSIIANASGGGFIFNDTATSLTILNSKILNNQGPAMRGDGEGATVINQSCIVGNSDPAVLGSIDARNNWWGAPDGPSGDGPGSGDSVDSGVDFIPSLTSAPAGCPSLVADFAFELRSQPLTTLLPGQPVSHTVIITNTGDGEINNLALTTIDFNDESQSEQISLLPTEVISRVFQPVVSPALTTNRVVTFTATISHVLAPTQSASASYNVVVPQLTWSSTAYTVSEETGQFTATVVLSPTNPYVTVMAQARISDTVAENFTTAEINFLPTSSSQPVGFAIEEDNVVPRQIQLTLQNPSGAGLGNPSKATLNVDGGEGVDFALSVSANKQSAVVGESILYTYRITNTGEITLTVSNAIDNRAGVVNGLIGTLAPGATHTATASYTVKAEDTSPLVNEVVVTADDGLGNIVTRNASTSVAIAEEFILILPGIRLQD